MNNSTIKRHAHEHGGFGLGMAADGSPSGEDAYVADWVNDSSISSRKELTFSMVSTIAISIVFLLMAMSFGKTLLHESTDEVKFFW